MRSGYHRCRRFESVEFWWNCATEFDMESDLERAITVLGGLLLVIILGLGIAELVGFIDVFTLSEFLVLFFGTGVSMTILKWWAS